MIESKPNISFQGVYKFHGKFERPFNRVGGEMVRKAEDIQKVLHERKMPAEIFYDWNHFDSFAILKTGKHANPKPWYMRFFSEPKPIIGDHNITAEKIIEMDSKEKGFFQTLKSCLFSKK